MIKFKSLKKWLFISALCGAHSFIWGFVATYITTLFTGLAHTIILGVICLIMYGVIRLRALMVSRTANEDAANS